MKSLVILSLITLIIFINLSSEVNGKRKSHSKSKGWGKNAADSMIKGWNDFTKMITNGGRKNYAYWHHKKDSNGKWHKRKYGRSSSSESPEDSKSTSSSSEESKSTEHSNSRRRSKSKSHSSSSPSSSSESKSSSGSSERSYKSKLPPNYKFNRSSKRNDESDSMISQAFMYYAETFGCQNTTDFLKFMAAYNTTEVKKGKKSSSSKKLEDNDENPILNEMSILARKELDQCPAPTC